MALPEIPVPTLGDPKKIFKQEPYGDQPISETHRGTAREKRGTPPQTATSPMGALKFIEVPDE